ncbi:hypothetical protein MKX03_016470, partial [Papaver bracteatum]
MINKQQAILNGTIEPGGNKSGSPVEIVSGSIEIDEHMEDFSMELGYATKLIDKGNTMSYGDED